MKTHLLIIPAVIACLAASCRSDAPLPSEEPRSNQQVLFEDGNYAMFIHFGLYSKLEGVWKGKTYRGNAEWIMNGNQAGIPVNEYMAEAATFDPSEFDAEKIVGIAKEAGMKYIVITSKHHEGFAMFDSDACDFNIKDATPFGRDVIGELADACHRNGLGIGFYYSQFQDWTAPGGGNGPSRDSTGREVFFDEYFRTKCVPQVNEITTRYGEVELIWFDTPGNMGKEYSRELVELVKKNQPGCLVSSRVGNGMGDYRTLGDMELPVRNVDGPWEGIDVMQVGWGYSREDTEWKSPEYVLQNLLSTIARGGTFMMNVGPDALGRIPEPATLSLVKAGEWIKRYPQTVYGAGPSPWGHPLQWGDAVTQGNSVYLLVYDWPADGELFVPGLANRIRSARICGGKRLKTRRSEFGYRLSVPYKAPDSPVSVIELKLAGSPQADGIHTVIDGYDNVISSAFADVSGGEVGKSGYMERFGEWKSVWRVGRLSPENAITWSFVIPESGYYDVNLEFKGTGIPTFTLTTDEDATITNSQPAISAYRWKRMGWVHFDTPGRHTITLSLSDFDKETMAVSAISVNRVDL